MLEWFNGGQSIGVTVIAFTEKNAGKFLEIVAMQFNPHTWQPAIGERLVDLARAHDCIGLVYSSHRPGMARLWPSKVLTTTYLAEV